MHKARTKIIVFILTILVSSFSFWMVVYAERCKKFAKYSKERAYYKDLSNQFSTYYLDFQNQVDETKKQNNQQMLQAKKQYEDLLAQQPDLIAQHTRAVISGQTAGSSGNITLNNSSGSGSVTPSVKVSPPSSKPRTATS